MSVSLDAYSPAEVLEFVARAGVMKGNMRLDKVFLSSVSAGCLLAFACGTSLSTNTSSWFQENAPGLIRTIGALVFPYGLCMIILTGADLCTGTFMFTTVAALQRQIPWWKMLLHWFVTFWGNLCGSLFVVAIIFGYGEIFSADPYKSEVISYATKKQVTPAFQQIFVRGIGCNWLVCLACFFGIQGRDLASKIIGIWWPIFGFVSLGLDHVVANMTFIPLGIWLGAPEISVGLYIWKGIIPTLLGNIVGGAIFVGTYYWYMYLLQGESLTLAGLRRGQNIPHLPRLNLPALPPRPPHNPTTFLTFLDALNAVWLASPYLQLASASGNLLSFVPTLEFQLAALGIQVAAECGSILVSRIRTRAFLRAANEEVFAPRGLRVRVLDTRGMLGSGGCRRFGMGGEEKGEGGGFDPVGRRMEVIGEFVSPVVVDEGGQGDGDKGWLKRVAERQERWFTGRQNKGLVGRRKKAIKAIGEAEVAEREVVGRMEGVRGEMESVKERAEERLLGPLGETLQGRGIIHDDLGRELRRLERKMDGLVKERERRVTRRVQRVEKRERKIAQKVMWVVVTEDDGVGMGDDLYED
ncbi:hypothetical protein BO71DRAFT_432192 [Aspergillus ellipticus CBS 707.79]|uniref:Formate/nitrite transporter n=1 Tax=Aspergillus ellipticus CBS 707.79 TaxID=1448320 RepID=A0A319DVJ0_9EURO|nr:hypothetical protein BO71DRAFT_432192 [Aspergillus ellipticus CBS 707.79]